MPNTREKLIELLRQVQDYGTKHTNEQWTVTVETKCNETIADHLIANGVTFAEDNNVPSKWIPVTERLPEGDKVVLCYNAYRGIRLGKLLDATYANGVQAFMDRDSVFAFGATHWMPLPSTEGLE